MSRAIKRLTVVFGTVFLIFLLVAAFIQRQYVVPIIMYHSVNPKVLPEMESLIVSPNTFERQMRFLKEWHYNVVPLESIADFIKNKKKVPSRTIAITFDDGYKDNYTYAFPILKKYNLPATIFIVVNEVDSARLDRLNWREIKAMENSGLITVGSHCLDHIPLTDIKSEKNLISQIFDSKKIIEEKLGKPVTMFCYPIGRFNDKVRRLIIDAGYKLSVVTNPGGKYPNDDIFVLKRLKISENARNLFIFWVETSGFYNFMREHRQKK